ncbi:Uncharacterized protein PECH_008435 [Penicillium ucsense]|uniref:Uncharacterized protein n=1 Tax=Penicillium ucsense TaxID=2839758 RepID=A0A8J8WIS9_9EURO|nr:Uncharacterized protein PECM_003681 [Penicillium ucsense]KAF7734122.1 Uncharacterized protein PECH_008435 [Penicillium ucsense]
MDPQVTSCTFCTYTATREDTTTTIFFITGNPGLIGYYHPFLSLLAENLKNGPSQDRPATVQACKGSDEAFQIYGRSLGGFEIDSDEKRFEHEDRRASPGDSPARLYDLEDQICFVHDALNALMGQNAASSSTHSVDNESCSSPRKRRVILIGHSVGAYIAMEVLRRHREAARESVESGKRGGYDIDFDIIGGVMLFPTVKDIAHSPSGQKLTTLLSIIPHFATVVSFIAGILTSILSMSALKSVIKLVMRDPPTHALETTTSFLKSRQGVRQALHMAADEMRTITSDKWTDDVWGVTQTQDPVSRLCFYFGRNDHWVAEKTREEIIAMRSSTKREDGLGPQMIVCEDGLPHAFCLKHSDVMARKVAAMIREIAS